MGKVRSGAAIALSLSVCVCAVPRSAPAQEPPRIVHEALSAFVAGSTIEVRARLEGGSAIGLNFFFRPPGVEEFQVRPMTRTDDGSFALAFDTSVLTGPGFAYYLEALTPMGQVLLPPGAPGEAFTVGGAGEAAPEVPADIPAPAAEEARFRLPVDVTGSGQADLWKDFETPGSGATPAAGNVRIALQARPGKTALSVDTSSAFTAQPPPGVGGVDLSRLQAAVTRGGHALRAGDLDLTESEYSLSGLGRRGLEYVYQGTRLYARGFLASSRQVRGFQGLGLPKPSTRLAGAVLGYKPGELFSLKAVVVSGQDDPAQGFATGAASFYQARAGSVAAVVGESRLFRGNLNLKLELAGSRYDPDAGGGQARASDVAYGAATEFRVGLVNGSARYRSIGRDFNSIGLEYIANDRRGVDANVGLAAGPFNVQGAYGTERDNVENDPARPVTDLRNAMLNGTLSLSAALSFSAGYRWSDQETAQMSAEFPFAQDARTREATAGASWTPGPAVSLSCTLVNSEIFSRSLPASDTSALTLTSGLSVRAGERFTFCPSVSLSRSHYAGPDETCVSWNANALSELYVWKQAASVSLSASAAASQVPLAGTSRAWNVVAGLNLQAGRLIKLETLTLALKGAYARSSTAGQVVRDARVFVQGDFSF